MHSIRDCAHRKCVIHNRSLHHMRGWYATWNEDLKRVDRLCPHGLDHPDPDQFPFWEERGLSFLAIHDCDGCCAPSVIKGELAPRALEQ